MPTFRHSFTVPASLESVARFHERPEALARLTPWPLRVTSSELGTSAPRPGEVLSLRMALDPLPFLSDRLGLSGRMPGITWIAQIEERSETGFVDTLASGPFAQWRHRHSFHQVSPSEGNASANPETRPLLTEVRDEITARFSLDPTMRALGLMMWLGLPVLFAYRALITRAVANRCKSELRA